MVKMLYKEWLYCIVFSFVLFIVLSLSNIFDPELVESANVKPVEWGRLDCTVLNHLDHWLVY